MTAFVAQLSLDDIASVPFIDEEGRLPNQFLQKIGAYAIYSEDHTLRHLGYSRNILLSLKQHLIRQPHACYWVKAFVVQKPSREILENILNGWQEGTPAPIYSSENQREHWIQSINVKERMTSEEQAALQDLHGDEISIIKHLKKSARRIEAEILSQLEQRGFKDELRFNPKLKESGLLDIK